MIHILDIAQKDLLQLMRDRKTFMFLLLMPIAFTVLLGYAFGGFGGGQSDGRLPVGYLDADQTRVSKELHGLLAASKVIRLDEAPGRSVADLEQMAGGDTLAAVVVVPKRYGKTILDGKPARLRLIADTGTPAGRTVEAEVLSAASRLDASVRAGIVMERVSSGRLPFDYAFAQALAAWEHPPIAVAETASAVVKTDDRPSALAHTSPAMMLQFAIAGLLTASQIIVAERKSRALQRLLTTAVHRNHILAGHYLAIVLLILGQFVLLILFGQAVLKVGYLRAPGATMLVAASAALCIGALGLLFGVLARSDEQAANFSIISMFLLAGLGGAWVPLEVTGAAFQAIGHLSPVAWAMDGFQNVAIRGRGVESALMPAMALAVYAATFFLLASWRFRAAED